MAAASTGERVASPTKGQVDVHGMTHPGKVRVQNEDHFLIASMEKALRVEETSIPEGMLKGLVNASHSFLFCVADGVGGLSGGDRASEAAVRSVARYVNDATRCYYNVPPSEEQRLLDELRAAVLRAHTVLREEEAGTATTLTMAFVAWPRAFIVHVGDSRGYRLRDGRLEQLTTDQTIAQAMVDAGVMSAAEADATQWKHVLASALGSDEATPACFLTDCQWNDVMLLCTDGLTKHVTEQQIGEVLANAEDAESACRRLVELALAGGGRDNVTVVVAHTLTS